MTFNYTTDRGFVALHEDLMGDHYQFDVVPQWVNGELQLKLSSRLTSETTMLNYFYPDTVTLTKASSSIWN